MFFRLVVVVVFLVCEKIFQGFADRVLVRDGPERFRGEDAPGHLNGAMEGLPARQIRGIGGNDQLRSDALHLVETLQEFGAFEHRGVARQFAGEWDKRILWVHDFEALAISGGVCSWKISMVRRPCGPLNTTCLGWTDSSTNPCGSRAPS